MANRHPRAAPETMAGHKSPECRKEVSTSNQIRQSQHLDGFKALRLDKIPKWGCAAREENGSDTELGAQQRGEGGSHL